MFAGRIEHLGGGKSGDGGNDRGRAAEADAVEKWRHLAAARLTVSTHGIYLGTGEGVLRLMEVQAFGKKAMRGADWARGAHPNGKVLS